MRESRVTGILSFYDEPLELLAASVSSWGGVIDHLVAVDGAYMLYPQGKHRSDPAQLRLITEICAGLKIGLTTHTPSNVWTGNEVQKRNHAVSLAEPVTNEDGWYIVLDADCVVTHVSFDWFEQCARAAAEDWGAGEIQYQEVTPETKNMPPADRYCNIRLMYRALPGLTYGPNHFTIYAPVPEEEDTYVCLWGVGADRPCDAFDFGPYIKLDHRHEQPEWRRIQQRKYYVRREQLGVEKSFTTMTRRADGSYAPVTKAK